MYNIPTNKSNFSKGHFFYLLSFLFLDDPCPWMTSTTSNDVFECHDGTSCNGKAMGWACCNDHGGRAKCPANNPVMCAQPLCAAEGRDYCCYTEEGCNDYGGVRSCE